MDSDHYSRKEVAPIDASVMVVPGEGPEPDNGDKWCPADWGLELTDELAGDIRRWRTEQGYTWRGVAQAITNTVGSEWGSNQIMGMHMCMAAARHFGEDGWQEPWN